MGENTSRVAWVKKSISVPAGQTVVVDSIEESLFFSALYHLRARDNTLEANKALSVKARKIDNSSVGYQVFAKSGRNVSINLNADIDSGFFELKIENRGPNEIDIIALRANI